MSNVGFCLDELFFWFDKVDFDLVMTKGFSNKVENELVIWYENEKLYVTIFDGDDDYTFILNEFHPIHIVG